MKRHNTVGQRLARVARRTAACLAFATVASGGVRAQEILPNDLVPAPAGTNAILGYYIYGHNDRLSVARGPTIKKDTGLEVNIGVARYVHYFSLGGMPAGWQVFQAFGSLSGAKVGGETLGSGSAFGAQNLALSAFFWPYANQAQQTYFLVGGFIYPPTGTYDRRSPINVGDNRWRGNIQIGLNKGITDRIGVDLEYDVQFYGDNTDAFPGGRRLSQAPSHRLQGFVNYAWTKTFVTSLGWEAIFGGDQQFDRTFNGNKTELQRLRAVASYFWTPAFQTVLEVNRDIQVVGGFRQAIGVQFRALYVF